MGVRVGEVMLVNALLMCACYGSFSFETLL